MKRLKAFWYVYKRSLIDVGYYKDLLKVNIEFSLKYFLTLAAVAALITTVRFAVPAIPRVQNTLSGLLDEFAAIYPDDLVITAQDGMWKINKSEPFTIPTPPILQIEGAELPMNLIVFDHKGTISDLDDWNTFVVVNDVNLITLNNQNRVEAYPLDTIPDGELTKAEVSKFIQGLRAFARYVPIIIISFVLLGTLFYFLIYRMLYLLVVSLVLLAIGNINGAKNGFGTYYKIALHTLTLPLTIEIMFILLGTNVTFPFWFMGINLVFGIAVIHHLVNTKAAKK